MAIADKSQGRVPTPLARLETSQAQASPMALQARGYPAMQAVNEPRTAGGGVKEQPTKRPG
eukprot:CAMPEP_0197913746 /NCGR_PEP_ID=MMETSP1439-20131203/77167_1 /TAXON_ID=66791 /ORGANISM="Gonyaulax spinifera, Strain CCMP409" /LENGTH=60 /DNA_ID=CAMNT_0043535617 /DNA_START=13 /DNA_END=191 /DNA_ORIENTATION=-